MRSLTRAVKRSWSGRGNCGLAGQAGSGVVGSEATAEAEKSVALLRKGVGVGYRNPDAYRTDDARDPLRGLPDFRLLKMDLAFPPEQFAGPH
jgi:hypothetical protein